MSMPSLDGRPWSGASLPSFLNRRPSERPTAAGRSRQNSDEKLVPSKEGPSDAGQASHGELKRTLSSRHVTMIAIGGAVGVGLVVGTGQALVRAGPGSILIAYTVVGFLVYLVMCGMGEVAAWLPLSTGFTGYAARYCDSSLAFATGYMYWIGYALAAPGDLIALALVMQYWIPPEHANPGVWVAVFFIVSFMANFVSVRTFGEIQFWLSTIKIAVFIGLIILSIILAAGGGPNHHSTGFEFWQNPGAFRPYLVTEDLSLGSFLGVWSSLITAVYSYLGTELVGVAGGEAQNPRKTITKAIRWTFWCILFFYFSSVFLVGLLVPYDSVALAFAAQASTSASASPFVVAIKLAGISALPGILNGCVIVVLISGASAGLYIATRTLYGLSVEKDAPAFLSRTSKAGMPLYALVVSSVPCLLAFTVISSDSREVFEYFLNMCATGGLLTWIGILITHICFIRGRRAQHIPDEWMPYKAPLGIWGSYGALAFCILIMLTQEFAVFICQDDESGKQQCFDWRRFVAGYLSIPVYVILFVGHKLMTGSKRIKAGEVDFYTGKDIIDQEELEWVTMREERGRRRKVRADTIADRLPSNVQK